eukprot:jgi/Astpho2/8613/Aster-05092
MSSTFGMGHVAELGLPSHLAAELDSHTARSTSLSGSLGSFQDAAAELSYRCSSMPGAFSSIADRLHLTRAGVQTTTASVVPALTRDLLAIPFGTAQQLLPVQAQRLQDSPQLGRGGEATLVVLVDCNQRSWPMRCTFDRYGATLMDNVWHCFARCTFDRLQGRFQFDEGWRQFADHWSLYSGEELHLQRRASPEGSGDAAIWLDVAVKRGAGSSVDPIAQLAAQLDMPQPAAKRSKLDTYEAPPGFDNALGLPQQPELFRNEEPGETVPPGLDGPQGQQKQPVVSVRRKITCPTYCSRLHVTQDMAEHLLPRYTEGSTTKPPLSTSFQPLFKHKIEVVDDMREGWTVQYEGFISSGQRHFRFTTGWTALVKNKGIKVGDTVVLERWTNDRTQLHIHVSKGATPPSPAGDGAAQGSSQAAARPAPRKQSRAATNKKSSSQA